MRRISACEPAATGTNFTCFTGTKVQILTAHKCVRASGDAVCRPVLGNFSFFNAEAKGGARCVCEQSCRPEISGRADIGQSYWREPYRPASSCVSI